jgi:hypothetical protein
LKGNDGTYFQPKISKEFIKPGVMVTQQEISIKGGPRHKEIIKCDRTVSPNERQEAYFNKTTNFKSSLADLKKASRMHHGTISG